MSESKKKKPENVVFSGFLARLKGFEPPTCRLGGGRSILLSYKRILTSLRGKVPFLILWAAEAAAHRKD